MKCYHKLLNTTPGFEICGGVPWYRVGQGAIISWRMRCRQFERLLKFCNFTIFQRMRHLGATRWNGNEFCDTNGGRLNNTVKVAVNLFS